ncbi:fibronectin type III domain-containing protein [Mesonia sp.]|uniref:fibronectin type III domain-containing protein n=1 Tax=Mesonia sp. TaxID=1960830 RepID=UPI003F9435BB
MKYGEPGFDPMTEGTAVTVDDSPNTTLTGLIADTEYEAYVKSICDTNDESIYTLPITFSTLCEATTVPFTQDFEEVTAPDLPNCGTSENLSGNNWETYNQSSNGFDSNVLRYKYASGPADAWYYTQGITLDAGTDYQISYKYGNNSTNYTEKLKVSYGTSPVAADMTIELANHPDVNSATAQTDVLSFSVTTSGVYYFGFHAYSESNQFYLYVDDIELIVSPSCATPTNIVANNISEASAEISWTENGAATEWEIVYGEPDFDPTTDGTSITDSDDLGETITNLDPETEYDVYVRAICGTDGNSDFSNVMTFITLPVPPANDDLCDAMVLTVDEACAGGTTYTNTGATAQTDEPEGSCWYSATNGKTVWFNFEAPVGGNVTVTTDIAGATLTDTHIAIYEAATDCADLSTLGTEVGCDEDGGDIVGSGYTSVATMTGLTAGETYYVQVSGYGGSEGDFCIEVNDDSINCLAPTDITFANTNDTSTEVTWTENGDATEWEIIYGMTGFEPMTGDESTTISDNDGTLGETLSGLTPETGYDVYVRALCDDGESVLAGPASFTTEAVPCEIPTGITFDNVDDTSADISWTENGDATEWEILYGAPGFDPLTEGTSIIDIDAIGETLNDLTSETTYEVYVRAICGEDNMSDWTAPVEFTTQELSVANQLFASFTYYPNPVRSELTLKSTTQIEQVNLYNLLGQQVLNTKPSSLEVQLNMDSLPAGVYLMKVNIQGSQKTFRLIKD